MGITYSAASLQSQVLAELGTSSSAISTSELAAVRNGLREGLTDTWHGGRWSWKKKRTDITLTASTPYHELPADYDALSISEIYRTDSDDGDVHFMSAVPDAVFERNYYTASSGEPTMFRVTRKTCGSTYEYILEGAPPADGSYTYSSVEYYCSAPDISFTSATVADTTPNMPTEFHDIWHQRALADAANVLGQEQKAAFHLGLYEKKLETAKTRRDTDLPKGPARTPTIPYGDIARLNISGG